MSPGLLTPAANPTLFTDTLSSARHVFLQPTPELHAASLALAKRYLDPLASTVSDVQQVRLQQSRKKRKRSEHEDKVIRDVLRLRQLHLQGFDIDQIWEQARRVIDAGNREAQRTVRRAEITALKTEELGQREFEDANDAQTENRALLDGGNENEDLDRDGKGLSSESEDSDNEGKAEEVDMGLGVGTEHLQDNGDEGEEEENIEDDSDEDSNYDGGHSREQYTKDIHGLNDGFFSIDDFNRHTEFLERQDGRGDPDDGAASDEEEVDWNLDPSMLPIPKTSQLEENDLEESESEGDDGPTFGDADLDAPWTSDEEEDADIDLDIAPMDSGLGNANEIYYKDFFEPPPLKSSRKIRHPPGRSEPIPPRDIANVEDELDKNISAAHRDIFEDDAALEMSEDEDPSLSTHERRQAALAAEIRRLEAEAVAKRDWAMSGEARATDRPLNSLLEEDLEFERTGKPVPVITAEVSSSLEEIIKQRILNRQFDEISRRLPGSAALRNPQQRRGLVDIDERGTNQQSLADLYEAEHLQRTDPNYVAPRDAKLQAAHAQVAALWADVSAKLDALSNWHYRPKPPAAEVSVVTDAPRITIEEARPSGVGLAAAESGLAPQEVYKVGDAREKGEVLTGAGAVVHKAELSREEKQRHHRRAMERARKQARSAHPTTGDGSRAAATGGQKEKGSNKAQDREALASELKRGGVKVIGKGGEIVDVEGKKVRAQTAGKGAGSYKL